MIVPTYSFARILRLRKMLQKESIVKLGTQEFLKHLTTATEAVFRIEFCLEIFYFYVSI